MNTVDDFPSEKLERNYAKHIKSSTKTSRRTPTVLLAAGSFNPPTYLHLRIIENAKAHIHDALGDEFEVIGAYLSPVNSQYSKNDLAEAEHRVAMCTLATSCSNWIDVFPWESQQHGYSRTLQVLKQLKSRIESIAPEIHVLLLMGSDVVRTLTKNWIPEQVEEILVNYGIVVTERDDDTSIFVKESKFLSKFQDKFIFVPELFRNDISSSLLRNLLRKGHSVKYLTGDSCIEYIKKHHLYECQRSQEN